MKFILTLLLISPLLIFSQTDFSNGYRSGWKAGYCYQESFCSSPNPPSAPIPNLSENSFQDGYNRGFIDGKASKSLKVQNQTQTNNNLIEGAGKAYGNGATVNGNSAFEKYNASNNYGIQPINRPAGKREINEIEINPFKKNKSPRAVILILNGYFAGGAVRNYIESLGLHLIKKKYYSKENVFDLDLKKINKKKDLSLSLEDVILIRYDMLWYNHSEDYKFKLRILNSKGYLYYESDFANVSSPEALYSAMVKLIK